MAQKTSYTFYTSSLESYDLNSSRASDFTVRLNRDFILPRGRRSGLSLQSISIPKEVLLDRSHDNVSRQVVELRLGYNMVTTRQGFISHLAFASRILGNITADLSRCSNATRTKSHHQNCLPAKHIPSQIS